MGVARALAADPELLLMDEPFGALDPITRQSLQQEMLRIHRSSGKTIVMVTHDIDEALYLSDRVLLLDVAAGPVAAQFAVPLARPRLRGDSAQAPIKAAILGRLEAAHAV